MRHYFALLMKRLVSYLVLSLMFMSAYGQTDTTIIVLKSRIGKRNDTIVVQDHLRLHTKDGKTVVGPFVKFKDGHIYTKKDTVNTKKLEYISVNSYHRQKVSSIYMAAGISGILNLGGINAAFSTSKADTLTSTETDALSAGLAAGYTIMACTLIYGIVLYNAYYRYTIYGRKTAWDLVLD